MKNLKKIILSVTLCGLLVSTSAFATPDTALTSTSTLEARATAFEPTSSHRLAMGGAGLGLAGYYDSYLYNPANITKDGLKIVMPSLTVTINNVYDLMVPEDGGDDAITIAQRIGSDDNAPAELGALILKSIPYGYGEIMTLDANVGMKTRGFGVDLAVQEKLRSYNGGGDYTTANAISVTTVAATLAFGLNIPLGEHLSIDLGAKGAFNYKVYSIAMGFDEVLDIMSGSSDFGTTMMETIPFASGYALPFAVGANLNLPLGFTISGVGRNFNGNYNMTGYQNLKSLINNDETITAFLGTDSLGTDESYAPDSSDEFTVEIPWSLDVGVAFAPSTALDGLVKPSIAVDLIDSYSLLESVINQTSTPAELKSDALESLNIGAQVRLLNLIDVRAGLSQGYKSVGVGLDLLVVHLDAAYYWREYGEVLGQSPSDSLSVKFSLLSR
ncbi:MAG: hypothetical protein PQJ49_12585 [Sphaerochaetaceae bacterium]|nr:hypothetical protein [Sphaerochaetaceae bacterium]MDC7238663.1 hypothetical protein [Sphaerochaetaceae bacterium]MDC7242464.1 hypothetical protein [Sphaerochaetaceae bacterium]MDC7250746.1 hypothetical protein [Sphaerochaetaceae bacterium]